MSKRLQYYIILSLFFISSICFAIAQDIPRDDYKVGEADILTIKVYDNPDLSGDFTVSAGGNIIYPLLGQIKVSQLTVLEIKDMITNLLNKDYLYDPIVSVTVKEYRSKQVKILGNVGKPGVYYMDRPLRFFDLLSEAQGISNHLGMIMKGQKARIVRQSENKKKSGKIDTIYIDLHELLVEGKEDANIYLKDGDIIYIPEIQKIHVIGSVKNPGSFPYEEGITVLKAITLAGGVEEKASIEDTVIRRIKDSKETKIKVGMSDVLEPDDILEITSEIKKIHVIGEVNKPGSFSFEEGMSVLKAITLAGGPTKKASTRNTVVKRIIKGKEIKTEVDMSSILQPDDIVEVPLSFW